MTTRKQIKFRTECVNEKLQALCKSNMALALHYPCISLLRDGEDVYSQPDGSYVVGFSASPRTNDEFITALERAEKILEAWEEGAEAGAARYISDREICGIFEAAFWR